MPYAYVPYAGTGVKILTPEPTQGLPAWQVDQNFSILVDMTQAVTADLAAHAAATTIAHGGIVPSSALGSVGGVATLDNGGKVPTAQLPAFVDDVLEFANQAGFPGTGETGKIYLALDSNLTYRWSGSTYVEISQSLALGETSATAYRGDRGKTAYDHSQLAGNPHGTTYSQVGADASGAAAAVGTSLNTHAALTTAAHGGIVASTDARLNDARTPTAHKASHATGQGNALVPADIGAAVSGHTHAGVYQPAGNYLSSPLAADVDMGGHHLVTAYGSGHFIEVSGAGCQDTCGDDSYGGLIRLGSAVEGASGGHVTIEAGDSTWDEGGNVYILAGQSSRGNGNVMMDELVEGDPHRFGALYVDTADGYRIKQSRG